MKKIRKDRDYLVRIGQIGSELWGFDLIEASDNSREERNEVRRDIREKAEGIKQTISELKDSSCGLGDLERFFLTYEIRKIDGQYVLLVGEDLLTTIIGIAKTPEEADRRLREYVRKDIKDSIDMGFIEGDCALIDLTGNHPSRIRFDEFSGKPIEGKYKVIDYEWEEKFPNGTVSSHKRTYSSYVP